MWKKDLTSTYSHYQDKRNIGNRSSNRCNNYESMVKCMPCLRCTQFLQCQNAIQGTSNYIPKWTFYDEVYVFHIFGQTFLYQLLNFLFDLDAITFISLRNAPYVFVLFLFVLKFNISFEVPQLFLIHILVIEK